MKRFQDVAAGFGIAACLYSLFQDTLGLEGYVAHCRAHWVSGTYSIPIAVVCLAINVWALARR
jgi:hypothetical protein